MYYEQMRFLDYQRGGEYATFGVKKFGHALSGAFFMIKFFFNSQN